MSVGWAGSALPTHGFPERCLEALCTKEEPLADGYGAGRRRLSWLRPRPSCGPRKRAERALPAIRRREVRSASSQTTCRKDRRRATRPVRSARATPLGRRQRRHRHRPRSARRWPRMDCVAPPSTNRRAAPTTSSTGMCPSQCGGAPRRTACAGSGWTSKPCAQKRGPRRSS